MPTHKQPNITLSQAYFWQLIWQFFLDQTFHPITKDLVPYTQQLPYPNTIVCLGNPGFSRQSISNFDEALTITNNLLKRLKSLILSEKDQLTILLQQELPLPPKTASKTPIDLHFVTSWNYLGQAKERESYISYVSEFFWKEQNNEDLINNSHYAAILENPWKISELASSLFPQIMQPSEFFSDTTTQFIEQLSTKMHSFELNPFMIHTHEASFQWRIDIGLYFRFDGSVHKENGELVHTINFSNLT